MKSYDPSDDIQTLFHRMLMKKNEELQNKSHNAMKLRPLIYRSDKRLGKYMKIFNKKSSNS